MADAWAKFDREMSRLERSLEARERRGGDKPRNRGKQNAPRVEANWPGDEPNDNNVIPLGMYLEPPTAELTSRRIGEDASALNRAFGREPAADDLPEHWADWAEGDNAGGDFSAQRRALIGSAGPLDPVAPRDPAHSLMIGEPIDELPTLEEARANTVRRRLGRLDEARFGLEPGTLGLIEPAITGFREAVRDRDFGNALEGLGSAILADPSTGRRDPISRRNYDRVYGAPWGANLPGEDGLTDDQRDSRRLADQMDPSFLGEDEITITASSRPERFGEAVGGLLAQDSWETPEARQRGLAEPFRDLGDLAADIWTMPGRSQEEQAAREAGLLFDYSVSGSDMDLRAARQAAGEYGFNSATSGLELTPVGLAGDLASLGRVGARGVADALPARRLGETAPRAVDLPAPRDTSGAVDAEIAPPEPAPARRFEAALRDPETGEIYTGVDHVDAIESAPDGVRERLDAIYRAPSEDPNAVGFVVNGQFMSREDGLQALRAQRAPRQQRSPDTAVDPEALSLARSWIDSFGGGPSAEARAIEVMREQLQEAGHPAWRQRLQDAIDSVEARSYVQGERTSFSPRVEEAWPEIYNPPAQGLLSRLTSAARRPGLNSPNWRPSWDGEIPFTDFLPVDQAGAAGGDAIYRAGRAIEREVPLRDLVGTQEFIAPNFASVTGDGVPEIVDIGGKLYIWDGHHRIARLLANGEQTALARVYGGSDDLASAAGMRAQAPDAGGAGDSDWLSAIPVGVGAVGGGGIGYALDGEAGAEGGGTDENGFPLLPLIGAGIGATALGLRGGQRRLRTTAEMDGFSGRPRSAEDLGDGWTLTHRPEIGRWAVVSPRNENGGRSTGTFASREQALEGHRGMLDAERRVDEANQPSSQRVDQYGNIIIGEGPSGLPWDDFDMRQPGRINITEYRPLGPREHIVSTMNGSADEIADSMSDLTQEQLQAWRAQQREDGVWEIIASEEAIRRAGSPVDIGAIDSDWGRFVAERQGFTEGMLTRQRDMDESVRATGREPTSFRRLMEIGNSPEDAASGSNANRLGRDLDEYQVGGALENQPLLSAAAIGASGALGGALLFGDEAFAQMAGEDGVIQIGGLEIDTNGELPSMRDAVGAPVVSGDLYVQEFSDGSRHVFRMNRDGGRAQPEYVGELVGTSFEVPRVGEGGATYDPGMPSPDWPPLPEGDGLDAELSDGVRIGGTLTAGILARLMARRAGLSGVAGEIPGAAVAFGVNRLTGGDPVEAALLAGATPFAGRLGDYGAPRIGQAIDDTFYAPGQIARDNERLLSDPQFIMRRNEFAQTLPSAAPRARRLAVERDPLDGYASGRDPSGRMTDASEMLEQGYYADAAPQAVPPRVEFDTLSPAEQLAWMDRVGFAAPRAPAYPDRGNIGFVDGSSPEVEQMRRLGAPERADPFLQPSTGRSVFGEPRRQTVKPPPPPLAERAAERGSTGAMQGVKIAPMREIAEDLGIATEGVKAPELRRTLIRELARRFDSTAELVAFLRSYGVTAAALGIGIGGAQMVTEPEVTM